ncbi:hypothetical protein TRICI_006488 [Trichomonascus ciferrii]|uniref:SURP motif domain-containing protein n=1 Tax=Trichomonascus ciferrii TaxID=44093 RepID=A0A642UGP6_9ASCO|nr:hypothetical protein TRICI_006488 [Trichomonascus ciferrii]
MAEYAAGRGETNEPSKVNGDSTVAVTPKGPKEPESFEFCAKMPPMSAQDLDIIKLTALHVARNGRKFLSTLSHKEGKNYQFDFLKRSHSLNPLYSALVEQYEKVLRPDQVILDKIERGVNKKYVALENAKTRAEWEAHQRQQRKKREEEEEEERIAYAQIDWHDFTVVETIVFTTADYEANLPPPTNLAQLQFASLEEKKLGTYKIEEAPPDYEPDQEEQKPRPPAPTIHEAQPTTVHTTSNSNKKNNVKVRPAGTSRRDKLRNKGQNKPTFISPLTGESVPEDQYNDHMRISQMDPNWKKTKEIEQARMSTSNLPSVNIEENLKRYASSRGETPEEEERRKRAARDEVQWDGYTASKERALQEARSKVSSEEEKRQLERQRQRENAIGPRK